MRKLLLGSIALMTFAIAIILIQISCKKEAVAQSNGNTGSNYILKPATTSALGGVIIGNGLSIAGDGTLSVNNNEANYGGSAQLNLILYSHNGELWTANIDGTNQTKIPITLPTGITVLDNAHLSPDGKKVIFDVNGQTQQGAAIYSCNIDGSNLTKIVGDANAASTYYVDDVK